MTSGKYIVLLPLIFSLCISCAMPELKPAKYASKSEGEEWVPPQNMQNEIKQDEKLPEVSKEIDPEFGKLSVSELIDLALSYNPNTKYAWAKAKATAAEWGVSRSEYYPQVDGALGGAAGDIPLTMGGKKYIQADISLDYLLFDFGTREAKVKSAKQALIAANWNHNQTIQDVLRDVPNAYYVHIGDISKLAATRKSLAEANESLRATKLRHQTGVGTIADVLQAQSSLSQVKLQLAADKGNVEISKGNLANQIGLAANTDFDVEKNPGDLPLNDMSDNVNDLIEEAKKYRPDMNSALAYVRQKEAEVSAARRSRYPTISGTGNFQWMKNKDLNDTYLYGGGQISVPLFTGLKITNQIRTAKAELEAAKAQLLLMQEQVTNDVWSAFYNFKTAKEQLQAARDLLASASESFDVSLARYKAGAGSIIELLDAQSTLASARSQLIDSRMSVYTSFLELVHSVGVMLPRKPSDNMDAIIVSEEKGKTYE